MTLFSFFPFTLSVSGLALSSLSDSIPPLLRAERPEAFVLSEGMDESCPVDPSSVPEAVRDGVDPGEDAAFPRGELVVAELNDDGGDFGLKNCLGFFLNEYP